MCFWNDRRLCKACVVRVHWYQWVYIHRLLWHIARLFVKFKLSATLARVLEGKTRAKFTIQRRCCCAPPLKLLRSSTCHSTMASHRRRCRRSKMNSCRRESLVTHLLRVHGRQEQCAHLIRRRMLRMMRAHMVLQDEKLKKAAK